jgi:cytoskeletal protein RodZ
MPDFGDRLRQARERRGVSLRDIAAHTKFSIASLEALERNDPARLPGGIFARTFVRSYAAEVGLDPEATVREFVERFDIEPPLSVIHLSQMHTSRAPGGGLRPRVSPTVLKLLVVSLMAMAIFFFFTRARDTDKSSGVAPAGARQTSRRLGSPVPKGSRLQ